MAGGSISIQIENLRQLVARLAGHRGRRPQGHQQHREGREGPGPRLDRAGGHGSLQHQEGRDHAVQWRQARRWRAASASQARPSRELTLVYKGRLLTPVHFGMTPKAPPAGRSYTLKAQILKGSKKVIGRYKNTRTKGGAILAAVSHWILMGTGNTKADGTSWIPFQRMSKTRTDIQKMTTISVPQMITSDRTNEAIMLRLNTETAKRLDHHMKRALGL